jgi:hypothetical protein
MDIGAELEAALKKKEGSHLLKASSPTRCFDKL